MADFHEINRKYQNYLANLADNIDNAIYRGEQKIVELNRKQLLKSKGYDGKPLVNTRTGSPNLSKAYAKKMNKKTPDIFVNGNYQDNMRLKTKYAAKSYTLFSYHNLEKYLTKQYLNMFGISKTYQPTAQEITTRLILNDLNEKVFK